MKKDELEQEVLTLLNSQSHGMLSTFADCDSEDKAAGFPFGSMVRFIVGESSENNTLPILLLSRIAEHSKHIAQQNKVSLLVSADIGDDMQQTARLTLLGEMEKVHADDPSIQQDGEKYFQQFPEAREYFQLLDFDFYRLKITKRRYVAGFGRAHWLK